MDNLYKLKLSLMSKGVQITSAALQVLEGDEKKPLSAFDYVTTSGLIIVLPGNIYTNANFQEEFCKHSENILDFERKLFIRSPYGLIEVACLPLPSYLNEKLPSGKRVTDIVMTHADRIRISPISGCNNRCQFCDVGTSRSYHKHDLKELSMALAKALNDENITPKHLLISGGTPRKEDETYLDAAYQQIIKNCPIPVDVMMAPREDTGILNHLLEWGCNGLSINIEINDEKLAKKIMGEKYRFGKEKYLKFIEKAVNLFGKGKVRSCIILGLEQTKSTLEGVRLLAEIGCDPVLSPFKPLKGTLLQDYLPPEPEFQREIYIEAEKIASQFGVLLGPRCIPCQHNTLTFPVEGKGYFWS